MLTAKLARCDGFSPVMTAPYEVHVKRSLPPMIGEKSIKQHISLKRCIFKPWFAILSHVDCIEILVRVSANAPFTVFLRGTQLFRAFALNGEIL